eukprot:263999-Amphidinium_carterae.1
MVLSTLSCGPTLSRHACQTSVNQLGKRAIASDWRHGEQVVTLVLTGMPMSSSPGTCVHWLEQRARRQLW